MSSYQNKDTHECFIDSVIARPEFNVHITGTYPVSGYSIDLIIIFIGRTGATDRQAAVLFTGRRKRKRTFESITSRHIPSHLIEKAKSLQRLRRAIFSNGINVSHVAAASGITIEIELTSITNAIPTTSILQRS